MPQDAPVLQTVVPGFPCRRGKARDVYDLGDRLVIVATDRISAFDWVMPDGIPGKGRILTSLTKFWLQFLGIPNHFISDDLNDLPEAFRAQPGVIQGGTGFQPVFEGRTMLVRKTTVIPIECVARGYLAGSAWKEYRQSGTACGIPLPSGLLESQQLPQPIFTPATKAEEGHDENISFAELTKIVGEPTANELRDKTLAAYSKAAQYAAGRGVIIADTKFEWGRLSDGEIILIDEALTPDSSRFWPADQYKPGSSPPSFDKQFLRDWLETTDWDKNTPPPNTPNTVIEKTAAKYREALQRLTGET